MRPVNLGTAYLLWCLCFFGAFGIHRIYTGKIVSGVIYICTFGLFFVGQLVDLLLLPRMVRQRNRYIRSLQSGDRSSINSDPIPGINIQFPEFPRSSPGAIVERSPMQKLLRAAQENGGKLSPAQAAIYTELEPDEVDALLREAVRVGYAEIHNDPETGAVRYHFDL